ncbi:MAG: GNAT family N-acetyltransferase [Haliea sp.]|jgi:GNAT superfamily N-acetyltransferase|nr:GNAT family N-acetyltransferase [Haliea sp.]|tara:strand:+ start:3894 stop:4430 length:537 start_codon:yes stop_codon:yes gene_type:complete
MPILEFSPLDPRTINVKTFDCGKEAINVYLRRYAARNMALNLNRTFVLPFTTQNSTTGEHSTKPQVAAYYTLAHQTLVREELPDPSRLPRYPVPVILLAQLGIDQRFHRQGLGAKTLVHALRHAYQIASTPKGLPALGVVLDVLDHDALAFYQSFDFFLPLTDNPMKLFMPMASLAAL